MQITGTSVDVFQLRPSSQRIITNNRIKLHRKKPKVSNARINRIISIEIAIARHQLQPAHKSATRAWAAWSPLKD